MFISARGILTRIWAGAALCSLALASTALAADDKPYVMKIALATVDDPLHEFTKNYAAAVEKDSNGRVKVEIYPSSQLGSTQRQVEGVQFGEIQALVVPPEFLTGIDERFEVLAAPGLVKSMAEGQRLAADPAVRKLMLGLGDDKGLHGVALFPVALSSVVARMPIRRLADFKGKKIRMFASQFQSVADAAARRDAKADDAWRCAAGVAGQRDRRGGFQHHCVHGDAVLECRQIRD